MMNINETLAHIQQTLNAPKSKRNDFGKYNYRNCEDILEAVKPLLGSLTLTLSDDIVLVGDRYYVKATATLTMPNDEQKTPYDSSISVCAYAREALIKKGMDESQITGAASSYARKYALNGLFCIDDTKDADHDSQSAPQAAVQALTPEQVKSIEGAIKVADASTQNVLAACGVKSLALIPAAMYEKVIGKLKAAATSASTNESTVIETQVDYPTPNGGQ